MNEVFHQYVDALHGKFEALVKMTPVTLATMPRDAEKSGVYLLSERDHHRQS